MLFAFALHWGYFLGRSKMGWSGEKDNIIAQWMNVGNVVTKVTTLGIIVVSGGIIMSTDTRDSGGLAAASGEILLLLLFISLLLLEHLGASMESSETGRILPG
jgi:hypothetical protein